MPSIFGLGGSGSGSSRSGNGRGGRSNDTGPAPAPCSTSRVSNEECAAVKSTHRSVKVMEPVVDGCSTNLVDFRRSPPHPLVTRTVPDNHILFQGWVTDERCMDVKPKRFLVLEGSTLSFYQNEENTGPMVGMENVEKLRLADDSVLDFVHVPEDKTKLIFLVKGDGGGGTETNDKSFTFSSNGGRDNDEWIEHIQEAIESIQRQSEQELVGFPPGQSSILSTPSTRNGDTATCVERGTPLGSDGRMQMSAPSLPSSEPAFSRPVVPMSPSSRQQPPSSLQKQRIPIVESSLVPLAPFELSIQNPHTLHLRSSVSCTQPVSIITATPPQAPLAQYPHQPQQQLQQHDAVWTPVPVSSSQQPTPWGEAGDGEGKRAESASHLSVLPPSPGMLRKDESNSGFGGGGEGGMGRGMDETTAGMLGMTVRTLAAVTGEGEEEDEETEEEVKPTEAALSRGGLTMSALEELAGGKRRPNPEREDMISMEERKQRVEEGMRRTASACRADARIRVEETVRNEKYQGWVNMSRRKRYMVLLAPEMPIIAATAAKPQIELQVGPPTVFVTAATSSATSTRLPSLSTATLTGKESFPRLALYSNPSDLRSHKPPKETIVLTADCIVESRRLPIAATLSSSGGIRGRGWSSSWQKTSFSAPSISTTPSSFSETLEPDTVIDLLLTSSRTGLLKTLTLQCFTVEEENRWISELQQAIGALTGEEEYDNSPGFLGGVGSFSRELSEHIFPSVCCSLS
ncbi:pleckstrin like protein [Nannochloropsis oceanica]